ncbi:MAG: methylenetetrahydrofolate reductase C-terminal domain-containing protein [Dehalococcoidales bacterium]|jgi:methylenetetrahydrofolate reductase (NADPH)|nr:methylenetetrahydrofolate reductase C-terminal domain-containing protein [Dehalococcoidales bacterium]MDD3264971.1 methylenetetrahydrofolate reductase C-terminal domain-containing protein [Dehalococcoidales bacterium]MDX9803676.1 methylenetetrahydrofolate reductase C-terminal domain-containing protein [Dehalococcoidales bacterium]
MENKAVNSFRKSLNDPNSFTITWEQIPGRINTRSQLETILVNAQEAAAGGIVKAISITDSPGGSPALASEVVAVEVQKLGIEPLVHIALRDKNRAQIESLFYNLQLNQLRNVLVISGDYPERSSFKGRALPAYDLDPAHVMELIQCLNDGREYECFGKCRKMEPFDFFGGVGVSPFKQLEAETVCQYYKLGKKIKCGAGFVISQIGFDARKMHELVNWLKYMEYPVPALANIYSLSYPAARAMNAGRIPGAVVTNALLEQIEQEKQEPDKGRRARLLRAAKMYAMAKGMGYAGAHIGGFNLSHQDVADIVKLGEELACNWKEFVAEFNYPQQDGYYLFEKDELTGLNTMEETGLLGKGKAPILYRIARLIHEAFFDPRHPFFPLYQKVAARVDESEFYREVFGKLTHLAKTGLFSCLDCGDCALFDTAYLCPVSQCPKERRLGPCGGSHEGWCEVYPGKRQCIWVRAYERFKHYNEEDTIGSYIVPPRDWDLWQTPSQLNFYLGRDHTSKRLGLRPPQPKEKNENQ